MKILEFTGIIIVALVAVKSLGSIGSDSGVVERIERSSIVLESGKEIGVKDPSAFFEGERVIIGKDHVSNAIGPIPFGGSERSYSIKTATF